MRLAQKVSSGTPSLGLENPIECGWDGILSCGPHLMEGSLRHRCPLILKSQFCCGHIKPRVSPKGFVRTSEKTAEWGKGAEGVSSCLPGNPCLCVRGRLWFETCFRLNLRPGDGVVRGRRHRPLTTAATSVVSKNLTVVNNHMSLETAWSVSASCRGEVTFLLAFWVLPAGLRIRLT